MKALRQTWEDLDNRYTSLSRRERLLVAAALVFGPLLIGHALFVDPQRTRVRGLEKTIGTEDVSVSRLQAELVGLQQALSHDPDAAGKSELSTLQAERDRLDEQLRQFGSSLVRPEEMNGLLERLLARQPGLQLLSLKTLPPSGVLGERANEGEKQAGERAFDLYRHGVEIRLEGNFSQLQIYVEQLEKLQQRLLWGALNYRVIEHPRAEMSLTVYTLSPDRAWLAL